jgi:hypothetical protein
MRMEPAQISLAEWDSHRAGLVVDGLSEPSYGGPLSRHLDDGDLRLTTFRYDNSSASLDLWNFLLTEEDRLHLARKAGKKIVGAMKDLGTVPIMAYALPEMVAFYPDGAWWIPCVMQHSAGLLEIADSLGVDESFCPVRAMLGAFVTGAHFPQPDLLTCSVGAVCDDFSAIAQRVEGLGHPITWWEIPHRRELDAGEESTVLPGGLQASRDQVEFVTGELLRVAEALEGLAGAKLDDDKLRAGIEAANQVRAQLRKLRKLVFTAPLCPMPALEMLIAEMLAIHFCSDREESLRVLTNLVAEASGRVDRGVGFFGPDAARLFWVNPVADLRAMNLVEELGGRICGTDYLFMHAIDDIPTNQPPMVALAASALADPMVGSALERARRICDDIVMFGAEGVVVSRIPGASHCALEGTVIGDMVADRLGLPVVEIEVPPVSDAERPRLTTRLETLIDIVKARRVA